MRTACSRCGTVHAEGQRVCPQDASLPTIPIDASAVAMPSPRAPSDLEPGESVGEYEITGILGRGGFGVVYEAVQPLIGKQVAIKVLELRFSVDPAFVSRFVAEARAVNQIRHRHIIDIFSFGQLADGRQYYVMELLHGVTLSRHLRERGKLGVGEAVAILEPVARALDAAHAQAIAHRDLKPDNVFIARDEGRAFPKLLDFGIAKLLGPGRPEEHPTITGRIIGTPPYMSPEQCRGADVDHRTDLYSLGVIAYRMLTGRLPFDAPSDTELMWKHISEEPRAPSEIEPSVATALDAPLLAMLAKDPERRPDSAGSAVQALAAAAGTTSPVPSLVAAEATFPPTPARRTPWWLLAGAAILPVLGVAVVVVLLVGGTPDRRRDPGPPIASPVPAASPSTPAPEPAPPAAEPPAPTVELEVLGPPSGTIVRVGDRVLGTLPGRISLPRGDEAIELSFAHPGYVTVRRVVTPRENETISIPMRRAKPKSPDGKSEIPEW